MSLKITDIDDAGGTIFSNEGEEPILNIQFSGALSKEQIEDIINYIKAYPNL